MKLEIKIMEATTQELANLNFLFGDDIIVTKINYDSKTFDAMFSTELNFDDDLMSLMKMSENDLLETLKQKNFSEDKQVEELIYRNTDILNLPMRPRNCLLNKGIKLIGELVLLTDKDLLEIQNFGPLSLNQVKDALERIGLTLNMKLKNFPDPEIIQQIKEG